MQGGPAAEEESTVPVSDNRKKRRQEISSNQRDATIARHEKLTPEAIILQREVYAAELQSNVFCIGYENEARKARLDELKFAFFQTDAVKNAITKEKIFLLIDSSPPKRIVVEKAIKSCSDDTKKRMHLENLERATSSSSSCSSISNSSDVHQTADMMITPCNKSYFDSNLSEEEDDSEDSDNEE